MLHHSEPVLPRAKAIRVPAVAPTDAFQRVAGRPGAFWLDSSLRRPHDARFSMMGAEPRWRFRSAGATWSWESADGRNEQGTGDALSEFNDRLLRAANVPAEQAGHLPFHGGAVGWFAYDVGRQIESLTGTASADLAIPDIQFGWYDNAIIWDHDEDSMWLVGRDGTRGAETAIDELCAWLASPPVDYMPSEAPTGMARSDFTREDYMQQVEAVREGIARGEYYQLNLVQRFTCAHRDPAPLTYLQLRELNPAPFSAYVSTNDWTVLSSSPERFLEVTSDGWIRTCPIKGTRPRGHTAAEDAALAAELLSSAKERAELLMIVDLLRNDLGRICIPGSIEVRRLHALESFATVHHLVGEVVGRLRSDVTREGLLRATFPGGSITGAPKVSAMQAIDRFEVHRRGVAMGAIGYFSGDGRIDLNIAIRTITVGANQAHVSVGAGIVWDSDAAAEYNETLAKARALFAALRVQPELA